MLREAKLIKVYFDGSYRTDGSACAGIVVHCSSAGCEQFSSACKVSVPLSVPSACQAELAAMTLALVILFLLLQETPPAEIENRMTIFVLNSLHNLCQNAKAVLQHRGG